MLTISHGHRRGFLKIGTAAFGGLTLANLLQAKATAAASGGSFLRDRAVVVLNLQGGPTQFETFDPNMQAPREIRSITGEIPTTLPGITFGGTLPKLAGLADSLAVIRSYRHGISSHGPAAMHVMAGGNPTGAQMGSIYSRIAGLTDPSSGMPRNMLVTAHAVGDEFKKKKLYTNVGRLSQTGTLPDVYRPFDPSAGGEIVDNMKLRIARNRLDDRRGLLTGLDSLRRQYSDTGLADASGRFQQQAFDVLLKGVARAFDLGQEKPETLARYDTSMMETTDAVKKRNSYGAMFSPVALGRQMLFARRLIESGCGFVTVGNGGWDMHGGGKEFRVDDGLATLLPAVDKATSAFIEDIQQRGLTEKVLLVITGEFGRTPRINKNGGRDHWGNLCTLAFAGGGLKTGQVVGRSDRTGSRPASQPISSSQVLSTIMHSLFDIGQLRVQADLPKDLEQIVVNQQPIPELF